MPSSNPLKYVCPKCAQIDKGFSQQWLVGRNIGNDGAFTSNLEAIEDTTLFQCMVPECLHQDSEFNFRVQTGNSIA